MHWKSTQYKEASMNLLETYDDRLAELLEQESRLTFKTFTHKDAHEVGERLYELACERKLPVTIDIQQNGQTIYHAALPGSSPDNDSWIIRKSNIVHQFHHSSYYMSVHLEQAGSTIGELYLLDSHKFAAHGGSFPIIVEGAGVIGAITVSGLPSEDDHALVVEVLSDYLLA